ASASGESLAVDRAHVSMWRPSGRRALDALVIPVVGDVAVLAAVFVTDPDEAPDLSRRVLADRFALSPAEARVAKALALGKSVKDIAEAFHLTRETTRWYVKQVLAKTGTSSQAQLVRLLLSMTAPLINPERT
ncbi:MAG TPA: helix-turn-helix transcriptional regulator, partial [Vicinamibacterales bacterium]